MTSNRYFRGGVTPTHQQPAINSFQLLVVTGRHLTRFIQQQPQQPRSLFTDRTDAAALAAGVFNRIEAHISSHFAAVPKPLRLLQGGCQTKTGQGTNAGMGALQLHASIESGGFGYSLFHRFDLLLQLKQQSA